jgi:uncharacterized protein (DUF488 family)
MFYRQKILLSLIEAFGGKLSNKDLQKYLFLFTEICQKEKSYEFVPYKYGCFSFQSYADRRNLTISEHLVDTEKSWELNQSGYLNSIEKSDADKLIKFADKYKKLSGNELVKEVYMKYPYYAINSEIASSLLKGNSEKLKEIHSLKPANDEYCFFTIGYEGASFEDYLNRLIKNNVKLLCDVRKNPLSRKYGFSKKTLSETLEKLNIKYVHMPELGIVSDKRKELKTQADYNKLFSEYEKTTLKENKDAVRDLFEIFLKNKRVAITCFEAEECMCHRGRVAKAIEKLPEWKYDIKHI